GSTTPTGQPADAHRAAQPQPISPAPITATWRGSVVTRALPATGLARGPGGPPSGTPAPREGSGPAPCPPPSRPGPAIPAGRAGCARDAPPPRDPPRDAAPRTSAWPA